ncbi:hypothetical protein H5410_015344 [Solanum commersonii]|uniref:Replication protein A OB domain-containing protein n=1 Tax=Solanum commersonii TaxID=4109 RepID=A0A9J5ZTK2_SOLCO|nr:hypothetical protein H5410_015344 [Solanum commersonii]
MLHTITTRCPHQLCPYTFTPNVNIVAFIFPCSCIHPDPTQVATKTELAKQSILINNIPKNSVDWLIRVLLIRRGSITPYKNSRHEGTFRTIILIQATLFNKHIETWKDSLKPNKSYYIAKGHLDRVNPNYSFVHIEETEHAVSTHKFSDAFLSLEHVDKLPNGAILDLICVLVSVNPLIQNLNSKRREIVVTNQLMEHTTITLWGAFAENDGAFLKKLQDDKPIMALCDVRVSIYKGINNCLDQSNVPKSKRPLSMADNTNITITPTKVMRRAIEVPLANILDWLFADSEVHTNRYLNSP